MTKTLMGTPDPEVPDEYFQRVQKEFRQMDRTLAIFRTAMELSRTLTPRAFPREVN